MKPVAEDDLEPLITECPSCRTRFRVAETQLQSARGRVRCGACLTVFNGVEHLNWDDVETFASDEDARNALDDLLSELEETVSQRAEHPVSLPAGVEAVPSGNAKDEFELLYSAAVTSEEPAPTQEPSVLSSETAGLVSEPVEDDEQEVGEAELSIELIEVRPPLRDRDLSDDRPPQGLRNVVPIFSGFEEDGQPTENVQAENPKRPVNQEIGTDIPEFPDTSDMVEARPGLVEAAQVAAEAAQDLRTVNSASVDTQPVSRAENRGETAALTRTDIEGAAAAAVAFGESSKRRPWVWLTIAAALVGILVQIFWYQFDEWGKDPTWRPVYASVCSLVGCELPVQSDLSLLRTKSLLVRSDPDDPGVLLVNAIIVNEAQFAQPFPALELRFTDLRGALVAGRRFQPAEYLAGEGAGMDLMPARTPVQIELEIQDPGPEAVNYTMKIR
jgi:predicted Zn finger-like uncharacterized protein